MLALLKVKMTCKGEITRNDLAGLILQGHYSVNSALENGP